MTKEKRSSIINLAVILCSVLMVIVIAFSNSELQSAWEALATLNLKWLAGCVLGFCLYVGFDGLGLFAFLRQQGYRVRLSSSLHLSFVGFYYANITPGSSGGQPMQIYMMSQRRIPVGISTSALTVKFFATQLATVVITALLWLMNREFCASQLGGVKIIVILGWLINFAAVPLILLVAFNRPLVARCARWIIRQAARWHWCKHPEETQERVDQVLETYHHSLLMLVGHPWQVVFQVMIGAAEMLCLTGITVCVYYAFGMTGTPVMELLTVAFMLFVSASYTPLPGASGAQEGGFLLFYRGIFTGGTLSVALLVWRFFTYYLFLLLGALDAVITALRRRRRPVALITAGDEEER